MSWTVEKGWNFRDTSGYVTDGANETYVRMEQDTYPITRSVGGDSVTFGWESTITGASRDRNSSNPARLAGINFLRHEEAPAELVFRIDLPATGIYRIRAALGDYSFAQTGYAEVRDTNSLLLSVGADAALGGADHYLDIRGTEFNSAALWVSGNDTSDLTFGTTILRFAILKPALDGSVITHLGVQSLASSTASVAWFRA